MTEHNYFEALETALVHEKRVVTYKWLSRKLKIDVNVAKQVLYNFHQAQPSLGIYANYYLQGEQKKSGMLRCEVVSQERLEEAKDRFRRYTIHCYSLQPAPIQDKNALFSTDFEVAKSDTPELLKACRVITNADVQWRKGVKPAAQVKPPADTKPVVVPKADEEPEVIPNKGQQKLRVSSSNGTKAPLTRKGSATANEVKAKATFFDAYAKKAVKDAAKELPPSKPEPKSSAPKKGSAIKKQGSASSILKEVQPDPDAVKRAEDHDSIAKMFDSDADNEDDEGAESDSELAQIREMARLAAGAGDDEMDVDEPKVAPLKEEEPEDVVEMLSVADDQGQEDGTPSRRVKKRRRVKKTRTVVDGKYMKTEDYSDWEEYSESEPDVKGPPMKRSRSDGPPHAPVASKAEAGSSSPTEGKKASAKAKAGKKGGAGQQKTLLSFFGKK
ncbi:DNA polymerase subunit Cdc27 [Fimicolochytrium jonesii]|uniref:DNA polymerase subunit Cdc27 n=1 Tax=Fimicolochytrium jonesii TaxID=1396493 RepID=UPI0022FEA636|nr:DNA polymerase subunit Cdc27 [Fimicolochytrium jonesii]KAI8826075.1 DNA polymerase subunit Cdc27 [Fimicolochytrium jonesii]